MTALTRRLGVLIVALLCGCGGRVTLAGIPCPCPTDQVCVDGTCQVVPCTTDDECPMEAPSCLEGQCASALCALDADCAYGLECSDGRCAASGCQGAADCAPMLSCRNGRCLPPFEVFVPEQSFARARCPDTTSTAVTWTERDPDFDPTTDPPRVHSRLVVDAFDLELSYEPVEDGILGLTAELNDTHLRTFESMFRIDLASGLLELTDVTIPSGGGGFDMGPGALVVLHVFPSPGFFRYYETSTSGVELLSEINLPFDSEVGSEFMGSERAFSAVPGGLCFGIDLDFAVHTWMKAVGTTSFDTAGGLLGCNSTSVFTVAVWALEIFGIWEYDWTGGLVRELGSLFAYDPIAVGDRFLVGSCADVEDAVCAFELATETMWYVAGTPPGRLRCPSTSGDVLAWRIIPSPDTGEWAQIYTARFVGE